MLRSSTGSNTRTGESASPSSGRRLVSFTEAVIPFVCSAIAVLAAFPGVNYTVSIQAQAFADITVSKRPFQTRRLTGYGIMIMGHCGHQVTLAKRMFLMLFQRSLYRAGCILALLVMLLALAACDGDATPTPAVQPAEVLARAAEDGRAEELQFGLDTSKLEKPPNNLYITNATGKVEQPGKLAATATALLLGSPVEVQVVALGDDQYMTDPLSNRWQGDPGQLQRPGAARPGKAIGDILTGVQNPAAAGSETLDGVPTSPDHGHRGPRSGALAFAEITATDPLSVTMWIGSDDFLARQARITGALMSGEPASVVRTLKFSDFDEADGHPAPAGRRPVTRLRGGRDTAPVLALAREVKPTGRAGPDYFPIFYPGLRRYAISSRLGRRAYQTRYKVGRPAVALLRASAGLPAIRILPPPGWFARQIIWDRIRLLTGDTWGLGIKLQGTVDLALELRLGGEADQTVHLAAPAKDDQRQDALDAVARPITP